MARQGWVRATAVVGLAAAVAGCNGWGQFRYDAGRTGHNRVEDRLGVGNVGDLEQAWSVEAGSSGEPVVTAGGVFVSGEQVLTAYEAATGEPRWQVDRGGAPMPHLNPELTDPAVTGGGNVVLVGELQRYGSGGVSGAVLGVDARTGEEVDLPVDPVSRPMSPNVGPPTVVGDEVFGTYVIQEPYVWGEVYGRVGLLPSGRTMVVESQRSAPSSVAVAGGRMYATDDAGTLAAYDAAGTEGCTAFPYGPPELYVCAPLWSVAAGAGAGPPAVGGGQVLVTTPGGLVAYSVGGAGGPSAPAWGAEVAEPTDPAVAGGTAYVGSGSDGGTLAAFDMAGCAAAGSSACAPTWVGSSPGPVTAPPTVANGVVYAAAGAELLAYEAAGCGAEVCEPLWTATAPAAVSSSIVVAAGRVHVTTDGGDLVTYALPAAGRG